MYVERMSLAMTEQNETTLPDPDENGWRPIACAPTNDFLILTDGGCFYQGFWQKGRGWME